MKILCILLAVLLSGCILNPVNCKNDSVDEIIRENYCLYLSSENRDNDNISAILKYSILNMVETRSSTYNIIKENTKLYFTGLSSNTISLNYTIYATDEEISLSSNIIFDALSYYKDESSSVSLGELIGANIARPYIIRINEYEYDKLYR